MHFDARAVVAYDPPVADLAANWLCRSARVEEVLRMKHTAARSKSDASSRSERKMRRGFFRKPIASSTSVRLEVSESSFARTEHGRGWQDQTKGYGRDKIYKGANIAPMMRAFDDRGKGGIITLEEFEDEVAGGFGKVSTRLLAGESRVVSARFFGDATGRSPFVFTYGTSSPNCNNSTYAHKLHVVKAYGRCDAMPAGCAS